VVADSIAIAEGSRIPLEDRLLAEELGDTATSCSSDEYEETKESGRKR
jgi:hypothetical protein